ncbi:MAG: hypothetical protein QM708_00380 [Propioniciclava sp.]
MDKDSDHQGVDIMNRSIHPFEAFGPRDETRRTLRSIPVRG